MKNKYDFNRWVSKIDNRIQIFKKFKENIHPIQEAIELMVSTIKQGHKILVFGNGGSAVQASHFAAELVNRFYFDRDGLPALALTTDPANLTAIANDMEFKYVFSRQLEALGRAGDVALGLTTSGNSANVIEAFKKSKTLNIKTVALCGESTQNLKAKLPNMDLILTVPSKDTPLIQEIHLFILHFIAEQLELFFFGGKQ